MVSFSLTATDPSALGASNQVQSKVQTITNLLEASSISEEDIFVSQPQIVPANTLVQGTTGFQSIISMAVKTVHVTSVSDLISNLYANGAAVVSQPVLSAGDQKKLEDEAFDQALKDAKTQAGKIASKNWKFIKKIIALTQQSSASTATATSKADTLTEANNRQTAQNGVFKIVKAVSVTYKMW